MRVSSKTPIFLLNQENPEMIETLGRIPRSSSKSKNWVGDLFWPLVIGLRVLGQSPLSYRRSVGGGKDRRREQEKSDPTIQSPDYNLDKEQDEDENSRNNNEEVSCREYKIVYTSVLTYLSLAVGLLSAYNWTTVSIEMGFGDDRLRVNNSMNWWVHFRGIFQDFFNKELMRNSTETKQGVTSIMQSVKIALTLVPLSHLLELICSWLEAGLFAQFLNNWTLFEVEFHRAFPFYQHMERSSLKSQRNLMLLYYAGLPTILLIIGCPFTKGYIDLPTLILTFLFTIPFTFHTITSNLLEDIKVIMTYRVTADAFLQIRNGMSYSMTWEKLTAEKVKGWRGVVHRVRQQAVLAGRYQKTHQLILITISMVLITDLVFILLNGPWALEGSWIFLIPCLGYTLVLTGRIYLKILAADRITHNESLVSKELTSINTSELAVQLELKFLHDMIRQNPTIISFGNYVTLNKRLILGIASQVVTYLIVLMQFSQSKDIS